MIAGLPNGNFCFLCLLASVPKGGFFREAPAANTILLEREIYL